MEIQIFTNEGSISLENFRTLMSDLEKLAALPPSEADNQLKRILEDPSAKSRDIFIQYPNPSGYRVTDYAHRDGESGRVGIKTRYYTREDLEKL